MGGSSSEKKKNFVDQFEVDVHLLVTTQRTVRKMFLLKASALTNS